MNCNSSKSHIKTEILIKRNNNSCIEQSLNRGAAAQYFDICAI